MPNNFNDIGENNSMVDHEPYNNANNSGERKEENWFKRLFTSWCTGGPSNDIGDEEDGNSTRSAAKEEMEHHSREISYFTIEEKEYLLALREKINEREGNEKMCNLDYVLQCILDMEGGSDNKEDNGNDNHVKNDDANNMKNESEEKNAENTNDLEKKENNEMLQQKMDEISARMNANFSSMPTPATSMPPLAIDATKKQSSGDYDAPMTKRDSSEQINDDSNTSDKEMLNLSSRRKRVKRMLGMISVARETEDFNVDIWNYILEWIFSPSAPLPATTTKNGEEEEQGDGNNENVNKEEEGQKNQKGEQKIFLTNVASVLGRRRKHDDDTISSIIFHACYNYGNKQSADGEEKTMVADTLNLIQAWYDTICLCHVFNQITEKQPHSNEEEMEIARNMLSKCYPTHDAKTDLKFLIQSLSSFDDNSYSPHGITLNQFCSWSKAVLPLMSQPFITLLNEIISVEDDNNAAARTTRRVMMSMNKESFILGENDDTPNPRVCTLSCMSSHFSGRWHRLYASDHDGFSFQSLQHSLLGYAGPTLLLIRSTPETNNIDGNSIIGAYTSTPIKNKGDTYYGNSECFLFRLGSPDIRIYRPSVGTNRRFVFFKGIPPGSVRPDLSTHGWGFGGVARSPRLFIRGTFEGCTAAVRDTTYNHGPLLSTKDVANSTLNFDVESLEVWGVGDDDTIDGALHSYGGYRRTADAALEKARKVDKAQFMGDFKSGMIESKMFVHRQQMQMGRGECLLDGCVEDDEE